MKISVVTTFNQYGYETYGKRMIETFLANWPCEVDLYVYAENTQVTETASNLIVIDLLNNSPELVNFKQTWHNVPKANGDVSDDPIRSKRKDAGKGFKWNAIRFAHKVYAIFHCAKICNSDVLIWMDGDMVCHSPITFQQLEHFVAGTELGFLGREGKYTECGLYSMALSSPGVQEFLTEFQRVYDQAESGIFLLEEWHDSFVFDAVRKKFKLQERNWSAGLIKGEGHPLINCEWGAYLDHLKGDRKTIGKSKVKDLKVSRSETYWKNNG